MCQVTTILNQNTQHIESWFITHNHLCPLITSNWLEEVLPVGQRAQASGFQHSQQGTEWKEIAQQAQKLLVPAENKTKSFIQQWKRYNPPNGCTLGFKFASWHPSSLVYSPFTLKFRSLQSYQWWIAMTRICKSNHKYFPNMKRYNDLQQRQQNYNTGES